MCSRKTSQPVVPPSCASWRLEWHLLSSKPQELSTVTMTFQRQSRVALLLYQSCILSLDNPLQMKPLASVPLCSFSSSGISHCALTLLSRMAKCFAAAEVGEFLVLIVQMFGQAKVRKIAVISLACLGWSQATLLILNIIATFSAYFILFWHKDVLYT